MLKQRVITAAIAIPLLFLFLWLNGWWLGGLVIVLALIGLYEYWKLLIGMERQQDLRWIVGGAAYIVLGFLAFFGVRQVGAMAWLLTVIWSTDTAAYEIGRRFGKHKLAPEISPHKTWEGAVAGLVVGSILGMIAALITTDAGWFAAFIVSLFISGVGQIGDLVESKVKRLAGVKDSGNLLPGHGGILDRFDSLLLASMFMFFLGRLFV
ncbi:MAG: phosphatidate cytidylyltransferase [Firmicutes bacterium]|nr:phosphatidate cytidylyltransferase [Bacillota bacterium]MBQ6536929.1 phosphatidate cytidylyltransferase [Bacillota bacterium]